MKLSIDEPEFSMLPWNLEKTQFIQFVQFPPVKHITCNDTQIDENDRLKERKLALIPKESESGELNGHERGTKMKI